MRLLEPTGHCTNFNEDRRILSATTLVSGNIMCMRTFAGFLLAGPQMRVGSSTTAIFGDLSGYVFGNLRYKAILYGDMLGYPLSACDSLQNK